MIKGLGLSAAALLISTLSVAPAFAQDPAATAAQEAPAAAKTPAAADMKMTKAQCQTLWGQALSGSSGELAMDKAQPYVKDFTKADVNSDKKISQTEWMDACNQGWIKTADASTGGETGGATSDRTPSGASDRTPGAGTTGAAGTDAATTPSGTSDRTPSKP